MTKQIRDNIYHYIPISPLELFLINQPEFLRLHRVLQNSNVYNTYPNNRASRFAHSLGAMHVAGLLYKSIILNSHPEYVCEILQDVKNYLGQLDNGWFPKAQKYFTQVEKISGFYRQFLGRANSSHEEKWGEEEVLHCIIFQSVRLAALAHDVGHPPYSHVVEFSLNDYAASIDPANNAFGICFSALEANFQKLLQESKIITDKDQKSVKFHLHEAVGIKLINQILKERMVNNTDIHKVLISVTLRILSVDQLGHYEEILDPEDFKKNESKSWYLLGTLISGEVDCDRLDNTVRDAKNCGVIEFVGFDFDRIYKSIEIIKAINSTDQGDFEYLVPGFDRRAISTLADFFNDRMRQYRWIVNHHNVVRFDCAMVRLMFSLFKIYNEKSESIIVNFLEKNNFSELWDCWNSDKFAERFSYLDDVWLDSILLRLLQELDQNCANGCPPNLLDIYCYLQLLYRRNTSLMPALWKRGDDYAIFAESFNNHLHQHSKYKDNLFFKEIKDKCSILEGKTEVKDYTHFTNLILSHFTSKIRPKKSSFTILEDLEKKIMVNGFSFFFVYKDISAYKTVNIALRNHEYMDLKRMSSSISSIQTASNEDLKLYGFIKNFNKEDAPSIDLKELGEQFAKAVISESERIIKK